MTDANFNLLLQQVLDGNLLSATLSSPVKKQADPPSKISVRAIEIQGRPCYQISEQIDNQVLHRNVSFQECVDYFSALLPEKYRQGMFTTHHASYHLLVNKRKEMTCLKKETSPPLEMAAHNRSKHYILQEGTHIPFLVALGVMTPQGKVIAKKYDKFRQVNRFLEMVEDVTRHLPKDRPLEVVDFGCGKSYLTFALYHYFKQHRALPVHITGLDLKQEVIQACQTLAAHLNFTELSFEIGAIQNYQPSKKIDLVISLHACDTATDAALAKAIDWNAEVILCVPCCQHELYAQIENETLVPLLRHGILKERLAALATDAARAELLTAAGYEVQILEFIDLEHTPKNLLLRAVKGASQPHRSAAEERFKRFKEHLNIDITLEKMIRDSK